MSVGLYVGGECEPGKAAPGAWAEPDPSDIVIHGPVAGTTGSGKAGLEIAPLHPHDLLREYVGWLADVEAEQGALTRVDPSRLVAQEVAPAPRRVKLLTHDRVWVY